MARKCNICGSLRNRIFEREMYNIGKSRFDLVKCLKCEHIFVDPLPSEKQRKEMYSKDYFESNKMSGTREKGYMEDQQYYEKQFRRMLKTARKFRKSGKLLDIGSAAGYFLKTARDFGYEVKGVEISKFAAEFSSKKFNLDIFNGELEKARFKDGSFDVVSALNVMEHVDDPTKFLGEIRRILKKDGLLILDLPSFVNSPYYGMAKKISGFVSRDVRKMLKQDGEKMPYHLYEYSSRNLRQISDKLGFKLLKTEADVPYPEVIFQKKGLKYRALQLNFIVLNYVARIFNIKFNHMISYHKK